MSVGEAAAAVGVSEKTIRRWITSGRLDAEKVDGAKGWEYRLDPEKVAEAGAKPEKPTLSQPHRGASAQKQVLEDLLKTATRQAEALEGLKRELAESREQVHDLTAQVSQLQDRMMKALPAPEPPKKAAGWLDRLKAWISPKGNNGQP